MSGPAARRTGVGLLALAAVVPLFTLSNYRLGILALVLSYAVASLAQNLLAAYADVPSLGNVVFFAASAYTAGGLLFLTHASPLIALPLGVVAAGVLGLVIGLPALRVSGMHLAVVSVALVFVGQELAQQWESGHAPQGVTVADPSWLLQERNLYLVAIMVVAVTYVATWNVLRSRSGRAIVAASENPYAGAASGIDAARYRLLAFVLSGLLTGTGGVVYMYYAPTVLHGAFTLDLSLAFLTMMIVGGSGSLGGSLLGAFIIGLLPQVLELLPSTIGRVDLQQSVNGIYALLLLVTLRFFPDGLWNILAGGVGRLMSDNNEVSTGDGRQ